MSTFNGKYTGVEEIILSVYRDMGMSEQINMVDAVEWAGEAIELINAPYHLKDTLEVVLIDCYKGKLPCDLHLIETCKALIRADAPDIVECELDLREFLPMRYTTDSFHNYMKNSSDCNSGSNLTYKINDSYINTDFESGFVAIVYQAIPVDDNGYPKIPDDIKFKLAVRYHIMWKLAFIKMMQGKLSGQAYQIIERDRDWYIGAAETRSQTPSIDMMESIKNNWLRLIPKINQHADSFKGSGDPEQRHLHNTGTSNVINGNTHTYYYTR